MDNRVEKQSWVREKAAMFGLWWRDLGLKVTTVAGLLMFIPPVSAAATGIFAGGVGGYVLDKGLNNVVDKNGQAQEKRARWLGVDNSPVGDLIGSWKNRSWVPFGPPRMAVAAG